MSDVLAMIKSYPATSDLNPDLLAAAIEQTLACFQTCTACADACLGEDSVAELTSCIRTDQDCAAVCLATVQVLTRQTGHNTAVARAQLEACIAACRSCGDECARHAEHHEHCRICAEACRSCEQACRELLDSMS
jgi:hypothetical protein